MKLVSSPFLILKLPCVHQKFIIQLSSSGNVACALVWYSGSPIFTIYICTYAVLCVVRWLFCEERAKRKKIIVERRGKISPHSVGPHRAPWAEKLALEVWEWGGRLRLWSDVLMWVPLGWWEDTPSLDPPCSPKTNISDDGEDCFKTQSFFCCLANWVSFLEMNFALFFWRSFVYKSLRIKSSWWHEMSRCFGFHTLLF